MLASPCKEKSILTIGIVEVISSSTDTTSPSALIDFRVVVSKVKNVAVAALMLIVSPVATDVQPTDPKTGITVTSQYVGDPPVSG